MRAIIVKKIGKLNLFSRGFLRVLKTDIPAAVGNNVLIKTKACAISHIDLAAVEGRLESHATILNSVLGSAGVIGKVVDLGCRVKDKTLLGSNVGVGSFFSSCGVCSDCLSGKTGFCANYKTTGLHAAGGLADYISAPESACFRFTKLEYSHAALLSNGCIGIQALQMARLREDSTIGLLGFSALNQCVLAMIRIYSRKMKIFVFAENEEQQEMAKIAGASWAGQLDDLPPLRMDAVIDETRDWTSCLRGMAILVPGGRFITDAVFKDQDNIMDHQNLVEFTSHLRMERKVRFLGKVSSKEMEQLTDIVNNYLDQMKFAIEVTTPERAEKAFLDTKFGSGFTTKVIRFD